MGKEERPGQDMIAKPEGSDVLSFPKLPLEKIAMVLQDFPQAKKLQDGSLEAGHHIRLELEGGKKIEGWLNEFDHRQFRLEALSRRWLGGSAFSTK